MTEELSCGARDQLLLDPATGRVRESVTVYSSLTDPWGEFGEPRIETTWEMEDGTRIQDVRHPKLGNYAGPDGIPCEHWKLDPEEQSND